MAAKGLDYYELNCLCIGTTTTKASMATSRTGCGLTDPILMATAVATICREEAVQIRGDREVWL